MPPLFLSLSCSRQLRESRFRREGKYHIKGKYLGVDAEAAVKIDSLVEDSLGKWAQVTLLGTQPRQFERMASSVKCPPVHLKGRRDHRSASDGPRVVLHPRGWRDRREDHMDHQSQRSWFHGGSFRINQLARELGYGGGRGGGE